jgi:predicted transcriptional regulator
MKALSVRIPDQLRRQLQMLGRQKNLCVSDLVRESLRRYVVLEQFAQLRKKTLPFAVASGFLTDEDIFAAIS